MTKISLPRLLAFALLLFIPLVSLNAAAGDVKGTLSWVPNDSFAMITADLDTVRTSPLVKQLTTMLFREEPDAKNKVEQLKKEAGFDVFRDLHALAVAFGPDFVKDDDQFVLVAQATVSETKLIAFIKKEGGKISRTTGPSGTYYELGRKKDGRMAFRGKYLILGGDKVFSKIMKKTGPKASLMALWNRQRAKDVVLAAEIVPEMRKELEREDKSLGKLRSVSAGLSVKSGIDLAGLGRFASASTARKLSQMVNTQLNQVKGEREVQRMGLSKLLNGIKIYTVGRDLTVKVKVSSADLNRVLGLLIKMM